MTAKVRLRVSWKESLKLENKTAVTIQKVVITNASIRRKFLSRIRILSTFLAMMVDCLGKEYISSTILALIYVKEYYSSKNHITSTQVKKQVTVSFSGGLVHWTRKMEKWMI